VYRFIVSRRRKPLPSAEQDFVLVAHTLDRATKRDGDTDTTPRVPRWLDAHNVRHCESQRLRAKLHSDHARTVARTSAAQPPRQPGTSQKTGQYPTVNLPRGVTSAIVWILLPYRGARITLVDSVFQTGDLCRALLERSKRRLVYTRRVRARCSVRQDSRTGSTKGMRAPR